jgi:hypothetical protein
MGADNMAETTEPKVTNTNGEVRIRSNVCTDPNAWDLVPGDLFKTVSSQHHKLTRNQNVEKMYDEPCCICHRKSFEILENGCDYPACRAQGISSCAVAKRRK